MRVLSSKKWFWIGVIAGIGSELFYLVIAHFVYYNESYFNNVPRSLEIILSLFLFTALFPSMALSWFDAFANHPSLFSFVAIMLNGLIYGLLFYMISWCWRVFLNK